MDDVRLDRLNAAVFGAHPMPENAVNRAELAIYARGGTPDIKIQRVDGLAYWSDKPYSPPIDYTNHATLNRIEAGVWSADIAPAKVTRLGMAVWWSDTPYSPPSQDGVVPVSRVDAALFARPNEQNTLLKVDRISAPVFNAGIPPMHVARAGLSTYSADIAGINLSQARIVYFWSGVDPFRKSYTPANYRHVRLKR